MKVRALPFVLPSAVVLSALLCLGSAEAQVPAPEAAASSAPAPAALETQLADRIRAGIGQQVALPVAQARFELEVGKLDPRLRLAPCRRIETMMPPAAQLWGRTRIGLRCAEGERHWQVYLPIVVRVFAPALVPRSNLPAGTVIGTEMLQMSEVEWTAEASPPYATPGPLVGRATARALAAGVAVRAADMRQRQWFAAGDTVVLWARGEGFVVSGEGQALSNGIEGQAVRVRTESGRILTGTPVADRRVEVTL